MIAALAHRGPDDRDLHDDPEAGWTLGHTRLAILDLTPDGRQPMSYAEGRLWITFNGEIYNFRELRADLEARGHRFRSHGDTEVLLAAYAEWGPACVSRLRGMFAFALVDRRPPPGWPDALLVRDRLGIKPLLYVDTPNGLAFASELRALMAAGDAPRRVSLDSLVDFLLFGAIQQPRTILDRVSTLQPGHMLLLQGGAYRLERYWDLHEATGALRDRLRDVDDGDAQHLLRARLEDAVRYHLVSDVPVGAFLSGGRDSSSVVALMQRCVPEPVRTFSVGFGGEHDRMDERSAARRVAEALGTRHEEVLIRHGDVPDLFAAALATMDRPSIDGFNTWLVTRAARSKVKVALSGLGGDELLAGYPHFDLIRKPPRGTRAGALPAYHAWWWLRQRVRIGRYGFRALMASSSPGRAVALVRLISPPDLLAGAFWRSLLPDAETRMRGDFVAREPPQADAIQQATYCEMQGYLHNTLLRDADSMSMALGLEMRPILLDHVLAEHCYALPAHLKLRNGRTKYALDLATRDLLPPEVLSGPKRGFELPLVAWMSDRRCLQPLVRDLLQSPHADAIFSHAGRRHLLDTLDRGSPPYSLWGYLVLLAWLREQRLELPTLS